MYSCRPLHTDEQRQDDQLEPTYNRSVPIQDVALKTCRKQRTIGKGGEKGSGISVRHDDDDDLLNFIIFTFINACINEYMYKYICMNIYVSKVNLETIVEGALRAPFSIGTTLKCRGRLYSIPWIAPLYS